jgi:hypothetical protein
MRSKAQKESLIYTPQKKKIAKILLSLTKIAIARNIVVKSLILKKTVGTAKSSSVYKSNNKFETFAMTICR